MDSTPNLDLVSASQASKEVTVNAALDALSPASLFGRRAVTSASLSWGYYGGKYRKADGSIATIANGTVALTASATNYIKETDGVVSKTTVAPSGWPSPLSGGAKALYAVVCDGTGVTSYTDYRTTGLGSGAGSTSSALTTKGDLLGFGTAPDRVPAGANGQVLTADSTQALGVKWASAPFDVTGFYPGVPGASVRLTRVPFARAVAFPANFAGSVAAAVVAATASTAFDVRKNGASVGTITFAAGATTATFTTVGGATVSFSAGDHLSIMAPSTPDATLAEIDFVLAGTR